jgi:hypothetical protein
MATISISRRPIGQILLDGGFIASQDLELALEVQKHSNELLGQVLVNMGIVEQGDLDAALSIQAHLSSLDDAVRTVAGIRKMLGSLLILTGRVSAEQIDFALEEQRATGEKLGDILIQMGLITPPEIHSILKFQENQDSSATLSSPLRLGEILVSAGYITRVQLDDALAKQAASSKKLGEVLVEAGYAHLHQVNRGIHLQRKLMRAVLVAVVSLAGITMQGCGGGGGGGNPPSLPATTSQASTSSAASTYQAVSNLVKTNYMQISATDYNFSTAPNFYYSTDNQAFWSIQANVASSVTDINARSVFRIDVPKIGQLPQFNRSFSIETGGEYEKFPGTFYVLDGQQATRKKVENGVITFTPDSVMSGHVSGSFDVNFTDYDSSLIPAPRYSLKGVFSFKMGESAPAS